MNNFNEMYLMTCMQELTEVKQLHDTLICRISGVSDLVLREQLSDEYMNLEEKLSILQAKYDEAEKLYIDYIVSEWYDEFVSFYKNQYIEDTMITCMEKTNKIQLTEFLNKNRMRIPTSLKNKRELCMIANTIKKKINIVDFTGVVLDTIGAANTIDNLIIYTDGSKTLYPKALHRIPLI